MCGLVGFYTLNDAMTRQGEARDFLYQGLIVDMLRGYDSTGVFYGHALDLKCGYYKDAVDGYTFVKSPEFARHVLDRGQPLRFAVGHNRAATIGSVSVPNAHPFRHGPVTGVQNGTVRGKMENLPIPMEGFNVDSDCLMANIAAVEPGEVVEKVISKIDGAYMLIWHDLRDGSLNFVRNNTRAFHVAVTTDTIWFASEEDELRWLLRRNKIPYSKIHSLAPGTLLKFTKDGGLVPEVIDAPEYVAPKPVYHGGRASCGSQYTPHVAVAPAYGTVARMKGDNRVKLGGKLQEVPTSMQMELARLGLSVEDRIHMTPIAQHPGGLYVQGYLDSVLLNAVCYGTSVNQDAMERRWTVRPIGVRRTHGGDIVVAKVMQTSTGIPERLTEEQPPVPLEVDDDAAGDRMVPGPGGDPITSAQFYDLTVMGCAECCGFLSLTEADEIVWNLSDEPICPDCVHLGNLPTMAIH